MPEQVDHVDEATQTHQHLDSDLPPEFNPFFLWCADWLLSRTPTKPPTAFAESIRDALTQRVARHGFRVLVGAFQEHLAEHGLPADPDSRIGLDGFGERIREPEYCRRILDNVPVLRDNLILAADHLVAFATDIEAAVYADRAALRDSGLLEPGASPVHVSFGHGDTHNFGRTVAIVTFDNDQRLVFKPRCADLDVLLRRLLAELGDDLEMPLGDCVPRGFSSGDRSWQEFVGGRQMTDPAEVERYFYRFGALTALMSAIGATDLHHENLIADGEWPVIVDSETVLQAGPVLNDKDVHTQMTRDLELSATSTMMLPTIVANSVFDVLISGIGVPWEQQSLKETFIPVDAFSDGCRIERRSFVLRHAQNVVMINGDPVNPLDHYPALRRGFLAVHTSVGKRRNSLAAILRQAPSSQVRTVLRPTDIYARYLDAATHPDYLADAAERDRLFGLLRVPQNVVPVVTADEMPAGEFMLERERAGLWRGDVPYFTVSTDDTRLHADGKISGPTEMIAPVSYAVERLERFADRCRSWHLLVLESSLGELTREGHAGLQRESQFSALVDAEVEQVPAEFAALLEQLATSGEAPDGAPVVGWMGSTGLPGHGTFDLGGSLGYHDFGGIVGYLRSCHPEAELTERAERGWRELRSTIPDGLAAFGVSAFCGQASAALILGEPTPPSAAGLVGSWLRAETPPTQEQVDVLAGVAGAMLLDAASDQPNETLLVDGLDLLSRFDVERFDKPWYDTAHGEIGLLWAQGRSAAVLGYTDIQLKVAARLSELLEIPLSNVESTAWCAGSAGLTLVAAELSAGGLIDISESDWVRLVEHCTRLPAGPVDLSLCHGVCGVARALAHCATIGGPRWLETAARDYFLAAKTQARDFGWNLGTPGRSAILGQLLGWSGYAETAALFADRRLGREAIALLPNSVHVPVIAN